MPRKPKENYHQEMGRPHAGLEDPARFGLTFNEVVSLIDKGKWRDFYKLWLSRQIKEIRVKKLNYTCPLCNNVELRLDKWRYHGKCCKSCSLEKKFCSNCRRIRVPVLVSGNIKLCKYCVKILEALKGMTNDA